ncbi:type II toxin-antitoxin system RelE/ParE family toxin (plasmid) [Bacillus mycoides]
MNYDLIFFKDARGEYPVKQFLDDLQQQATKDKQSSQLLKQTVHYFKVLRGSGTRSGEPFTKFIGDGIWELRPGNHRIFFFMWENNRIVLLHSFRKKTRKTPKREIEKAMDEKNDWLANGTQREN